MGGTSKVDPLHEDFKIRQRGAKLFWLHPNKELPGSQATVRSSYLFSGFMSVNSLQSLKN